MAKKQPKVEYRKRLSHSTTPVDYLDGPYFVEGNFKKFPGGVREPVWYDPAAERFVFADGRLAFDAAPSKHPPLKKSEREKQREALQMRLAEEQAKLNDAKRAADRAKDAKARSAANREIKRLDALKQDIVKDLDKLKTSTQKVDEKARATVEKRFIPRGGLKTGDLPVLTEYDRKSDKVRFFFAGARADADGRLLDCDPKLRQCKTVAPAVRTALLKIAENGINDTGERGFFAVSSWDYPKAVQVLSQLPVRLYGAPELDISKKFRSLDAKARAVDSRDIEFGEFKPKVGETQDGKRAPFQEEGIKFLMSRDHAILADDMGLGKTYQAIVAAHNAVPKSEQILILCPAAVVGSWLNDIAKFMPSAPAIGFTTQYINKEGEPSKRPEKVRFFVCSYQGASSQQGKAAVSKLLLSKQWGLVILDEAHRLKKHKTLGHKFVEMLKAERMWFLTGTPISNRVIDYYGLLKLAHHPAGNRIDDFRKNYQPQVIKAGKTEVAEETEPLTKLGKDLSGFVLRRTKEEVLSKDLPKKIGGLAGGGEGFIKVNLPEEFSAALEQMAEDDTPRERLRHALAVAKVPATWEVAERVIDAGDKVVLFSTYTDVLHSFMELCDEAKVLYIVISGEVSTLGKSAMVKLFQGEPLETKTGQDEEKWAKKNLGQWFLNLVRYVPTTDWSKADLEEARKRFGANEAKWPHEIQVVLAQMVAASEGVTLTRADTLLFNDFDYMPSRHEQAEDRIYRLSKSGKLPHPAVFIGYMYADDPTSIDKAIITGLFAKRSEILDVYDATDMNVGPAFKRVRDKFMKELEGVEEAKASRYIKRNPARFRNPSTMGL